MKSSMCDSVIEKLMMQLLMKAFIVFSTRKNVILLFFFFYGETQIQTHTIIHPRSVTGRRITIVANTF